MENEKKIIIEKLVQDFKNFEKDEGIKINDKSLNASIREIRARLEGFTLEELELLGRDL